MDFDITKHWDELTNLVVKFGTQLVTAIIVLIVGFWLIKRFSKLLKKIMVKREVDESLIPFVRSVVSIILKVVLLITVVGILGIETTSFIAVLGSAGLAIGLALQGSLANFAGGVLILTIKPFSKGDFIDASGTMGTVEQINIFNTVLKTPNNQKIYVPNGSLAGSVITNYSQEDTRRLVLTIGISYEDDIKKAKQILSDLVAQNEVFLKDPSPFIGVGALADSSVNLECKLWVPSAEYWNMYYKFQEDAKYALEAGGITIPFPQRDVHMIKD